METPFNSGTGGTLAALLKNCEKKVCERNIYLIWMCILLSIPYL